MWSDEKLVINRTNKLQNPIMNRSYLYMLLSLVFRFLFLFLFFGFFGFCKVLSFSHLKFLCGNHQPYPWHGDVEIQGKNDEILNKGGIHRHSRYTCASMDNPNGFGGTAHESNSQPSSM